MKSIFFISVFFILNINAQKVNLFISEITDQRSTNPEECFLQIKYNIQGIKISDNAEVKILEATGVDNLNNELEISENGYSSFNEREIKLESPPRKAEKLKYIKGVIEIFEPSEKNKSIIKHKDITKLYNKNLIAEKDVKLILINEEELEKLKTKNQEEYDKKVKEIKEINEIAGGLFDFIESFKDIFSSFGGNEENSISFLINGDSEKISKISLDA